MSDGKTMVITVFDNPTGKRRKKVAEANLNQAQMMQLYRVGMVSEDKQGGPRFAVVRAVEWRSAAKLHRELRGQGLVYMRHVGLQDYRACLTEIGKRVWDAIDKAAHKHAKERAS
jgi:hypothetical protein